jgi:hypothetical protein
MSYQLPSKIVVGSYPLLVLVQPTVRPTASPSNYRSVTVRVQQQVDGVSLATAQVRPPQRPI